MKILCKGLFAVLALTIAGCTDQEEGRLEIKGTVKNMGKVIAQYPGIFRNDSLKLFLYEVPFGSDAVPIQLDTAFVSARDSSFTLFAETNSEGLYDVMIENGPVIPLVNDGKELTLEIDLLNRERYYSIKGSAASEQMRDFIFTYSEKSAATNNAFKRLDSLKLYQSNDSLLLSATNEKNASVESVNNYVKNFLSTVNHSTVAAFVLGTASSTFPQNEFEAVLNKMVQKYPADSNLILLKNQLDARKSQAAGQQPSSASWIGKASPELVMPDTKGKNVSISSFKGKYVLVDFWASWCRPCRMENPNIVKAYNRFKDQNFTMLGVSLDKEKDNWLQAIQQDNLTWTHISDLAYWNSKAVDIFRFEGIPYNVLIDPNGVIIAEGLRGAELERKLEEVLK